MKLLLKVGLLIDGTRKHSSGPAMVAVEDGRITAIAPEITPDQDTRVIDASDQTLMPGMIDCHVHVMASVVRLEESLGSHRDAHRYAAARTLERTLRAGFTTVRDAGGADPGLCKAIELGQIKGPRVLTAAIVRKAGPHLAGPPPAEPDSERPIPEVSPFRASSGLEQLRRAVGETLTDGYDFINVSSADGTGVAHDSSSLTRFTQDEMRTIVQTAMSRGKKVMACARVSEEIRLAVEGGVWSLEQGIELGNQEAEMMARQGTYYVPSARLFYEADEKTKSIVVNRMRREYDGMAERLLVSIARARRAGVRIAAGSDAMYDTHGQNARELVALVMTGLTPRQAVVAATRMAAETCGIDHLVGTLEPGKLADMLLVRGNPLDDIRVLTEQDRLTVFKQGIPI